MSAPAVTLGAPPEDYERLFQERFGPRPYDLDQEHEDWQQDIGQFLQWVNEPNHKSVVFLEQLPYFVTIRYAMYLKRHGWSVYLLSFDWQDQVWRPLFEKYFDGVLDLGGNVGRLRHVLSHARPTVVHAQCRMFYLYLARLAIDLAQNSKVIVDFYDVPSIQAPRDELYQTYESDDVTVMLGCEDYVAAHADGVVCRMGEHIEGRMREGRPRFPPYLQFWPYPVAEFRAPGWDTIPDFDPENVKLLFAGQMACLGNPKVEQMLSPSGFLPAAEQLLAQGFTLDVLHNPNVLVDIPELHHYATYARENRGFRFINGFPPDEFGRPAQHYHFGIILHVLNPAGSTYSEDLRRFGVGTKPFAYFEAGLPLIINAEHEYSASLVVDNGCGLAISTREIPHLREILREVDYAALKRGVVEYNLQHGMHVEIHRLLAFYQQCGAC